MGATKLIQIDSYMPCLTDKDIESAHKSIIDEIDIYNESGCKTFKFECVNGIEIYVEVEYVGFNYRRIRLQNTYVTYKIDDEYKSVDDCEEALDSLIHDSIYILNAKEEEEYELKEQYS